MNKRDLRISINDRLLWLEKQLRELVYKLNEKEIGSTTYRHYVNVVLAEIVQNWKFIRKQIQYDLMEIENDEM